MFPNSLYFTDHNFKRFSQFLKSHFRIGLYFMLEKAYQLTVKDVKY